VTATGASSKIPATATVQVGGHATPQAHHPLVTPPSATPKPGGASA
jgi:hypothetical protein